MLIRLEKRFMFILVSNVEYNNYNMQMKNAWLFIFTCYLHEIENVSNARISRHMIKESRRVINVCNFIRKKKKLIHFRGKCFTGWNLERCYFSLRCDVRLSCILITTASINSGITTPLTSMKFATDLVTLVSLKIPIDALLTDSTKLYLSSYFFK